MTARHAIRWSAAIAIALPALSGCGSVGGAAAFNARFPDNREEPTAEVVRALPAAQAPEATQGRAIAVGTTEADPRAVVAFELESGRQLWSTTLPAMTRPQALGNVVVTSTRDEVVALDLATGRQRWRKSTEGLAYVGAARSGDTIAFVLNVGAGGGEVRESRIVGVDAESGRGRWDHRLGAVLGRPAARGPYAFVPWDRQNIAVLDMASGDEVARLRSTDDVIDWVDANEAGVFYGSRGTYRLTANAYLGTREAGAYREAPVPEAPKDPLVNDDAFFPMPGMRSARGKIRFYFQPEPTSDEAGEPFAIVGDTVYYVYFRYVYAFDEANRLRWVTMLPGVVTAGQALDEGLLVATESGQVALLGLEDGAVRWERSLGVELASLELDAASFDPPLSAGASAQPTADAMAADADGAGDAGDEAASTGDGEAADADDDAPPASAQSDGSGIGAPGTDPEVLRESLIRVATDPDNRLIPGRAFAVKLLAGLEDPEITRDLLDLYAQRSMPSALRDAIVDALQTRSEGTTYLVEALDQQYDFLEGTQSPPLALIVPSLVESQTTDAIPGLVRQLEDHETPLQVMPQLVEAVAVLGGDAVKPTLESFLVRYHADSTFREDPRALMHAADAFFEPATEDGRALLTKLSNDPTTLPPLKAHIDGLFAAEAQRAANMGFEEVEAAELESRRRDAAFRSGLPRKLTQSQIQLQFAENADVLRDCIVAEIERDPELGQVRFVFIIDDDGTPHDFAFAPNSEAYVDCVAPLVRGFRYPEFTDTRQFATVTLNLRSSGDAAIDQDQSQQCGENDPWWTCYRAVSMSGQPLTATVASDTKAWWEQRDPPEDYVSIADERRQIVNEPIQDANECPPGMPNCRANQGGEGAATATGGTTTTTSGEGATEGEGTTDGEGGEQGGDGEETPWWLDAADGGEEE